MNDAADPEVTDAFRAERPPGEGDGYPYRGRPETVRRRWNTCAICSQLVGDLWGAVVIDPRGAMAHRSCWGTR